MNKFSLTDLDPFSCFSPFCSFYVIVIACYQLPAAPLRPLPHCTPSACLCLPASLLACLHIRVEITNNKNLLYFFTLDLNLSLIILN